MTTPSPLIQLPDVELVVVKYLRDQLDGVAHVGLVFPENDQPSNFPFVRVTRIAGQGRHFTKYDDPVVDIDVWALTNASVNSVGGLTRALLSAMRWHVDSALHVTVTGTSEVTGPQRLPESDPKYVRLGFTVGLTVRLLPG